MATHKVPAITCDRLTCDETWEPGPEERRAWYDRSLREARIVATARDGWAAGRREGPRTDVLIRDYCPEHR